MIVSFITAFLFGTFSVFGGRLIYNNTCKDLNDDEENNENYNNETNNSHKLNNNELNDNESILTLQNVMDSLRIKLSNNLLYTIREKNENSDDEKNEDEKDDEKDEDGYNADIDGDKDVDDDAQTEEEDTEEETEINKKKTLFHFLRIPFFS